MTDDTKTNINTEDQIPVAVWTGSFRLFGLDVKCAVLDNGMRIIEADSIREIFHAVESGIDPGDITDFARWQQTGQLPDGWME